jgi:D-arginine dehydrogenase
VSRGGTGSLDVVVIGGGIAGASLAYFLTVRGVRRVLVLEREDQPAMHASGRSAAVLSELDPIPALQRLKTQGAQFLRQPPAGFAEHAVVERSGVLVLLGGASWTRVSAGATEISREGIRLELLSRAEATSRVPVLAGGFDGAAFLPDDGRIDVHGLLWGYLGQARRHGAVFQPCTEVRGLLIEAGRCVGVATDAGEHRARWVVNAAGAWAGETGERAGAVPIRLVPHRRTIVIFPPPPGLEVRGWPFVVTDPPRLYFAPESGGVLLSPMDEEPLAPCDARPDELVVAEAIERLRALAPPLVPRTIRHAWAGLRTFAPDRLPVVGADPLVDGFFWLAGQGGHGIETSPALGQVAADLLVAGATSRFDAGLLSPARFLV